MYWDALQISYTPWLIHPRAYSSCISIASIEIFVPLLLRITLALCWSNPSIKTWFKFDFPIPVAPAIKKWYIRYLNGKNTLTFDSDAKFPIKIPSGVKIFLRYSDRSFWFSDIFIEWGFKTSFSINSSIMKNTLIQWSTFWFVFLSISVHIIGRPWITYCNSVSNSAVIYSVIFTFFNFCLVKT